VILDCQFGVLGLEGGPEVGDFGEEEVDLTGVGEFEGSSLLLGEPAVLIADGIELSLPRLLNLPQLPLQGVDGLPVGPRLSLIGVLDLGVVFHQRLDLRVLGDEELCETVVFSIEGVVFKSELLDGGLQAANGTALH
jgi:hypothetical protein